MFYFPLYVNYICSLVSPLALHGHPLPTSTTCPSVGSFHVKDHGNKVDVNLQVISPCRTRKDSMDVDAKRNKHVVEGYKLLACKEIGRFLTFSGQ
jgi:hypothetical protein